MRVAAEHDYDCDTDTLFSVFTSRDYLQEKFAGLGTGPLEFRECGRDGDCFRVSFKRRLPGISTRGVPRIARRFVRDSYTMVVTEEWLLDSEDGKNGHFQLRIEDAPVRIEGDMALQPASRGCSKMFDFQISSSIPVVGRKVETEARKLLDRSLEKEYQFTREYLGRTA